MITAVPAAFLRCRASCRSVSSLARPLQLRGHSHDELEWRRSHVDGFHARRDEEFGFCAACDGEVSIAPRVYLFGDDNALCFDCATKLHGVYDEPGSRWTVEPELAELRRASSDEA